MWGDQGSPVQEVSAEDPEVAGWSPAGRLLKPSLVLSHRWERQRPWLDSRGCQERNWTAELDSSLKPFAEREHRTEAVSGGGRGPEDFFLVRWVK